MYGKMNPIKNQKRPVKTVEITFKILSTIRHTDKATLQSLSENLDFAKSTIHRHLGTLERHGFVMRQEGEYTIGMQFLDYGIKVRNSHSGFDLAHEKTRQLADRTSELCVFLVEQHGRGYILCREEGSNAVRTGTRVGKPVYLHATAGGKAILSQYSDEEVKTIIDRWGLPAHTENTITDQQVLFEELERIRDQKFALNREEHIMGLQTVAAPIRNGGRTIGALCISGPANRMTGEYLKEENTDLLLNAVNELELNLKYD
jgi:DNA-binding IclR family transcriptional regulator